MTAPDLSHFAWIALHQMKGGDVWDGDLVSKTGRNELVVLSLARRWNGGMNGLTDSGRQLASKMTIDGWDTGKRN